MASDVYGATTARLFFALWPPADVAATLHRLSGAVVGRCGGRLLRPESFHLTLAFLGEVAERRLPELREVASGIELPKAAVRLDKLGYWKHNQILFAGSSQPAPALSAIAATLQEKLCQAGFLSEARPLVPHVTLLRKILHPGELPELEAQEWLASELVLARSWKSDRGTAYDAIERWPLV